MTSAGTPSSGGAAGGKNRRRFPRYDVALSVIMRRPGGEVLLSTGDVSRHGAFLRTHEVLPLAQVVQLRFVIPHHGTIDAMCTIARVLTAQVPQGPGLGVDFFAVSKDAKALWERFINDLKSGVPVPPPSLVSTLSSMMSTAAPMIAPHALPQAPPSVAPSPVAPSPVVPSLVAPSPVAPSPVAPSPVAPSPVAPSPVAPSPVAPSPVAPSPDAPPMLASPSDYLSPRGDPFPSAPWAQVSLVPTPAESFPADDDLPLAPLDANVLFLKFPDVTALEVFQRDQFNGEGVFIQTSFVKEIGDTVDVVLIHPESDDEFRLEGTVVHRVVTGPSQHRGLGVFFRQVGLDVAQRLRLFVESGAPAVDLVEEASGQQMTLEGQARREPDNPVALEELAQFHLRFTNDVGQAISLFTRALVLSPATLSIHAGLTEAYRRVGDLRRCAAHEHIARALMAFTAREWRGPGA